MMLDFIETVELKIVFGIKVGKSIDEKEKENLIKRIASQISQATRMQTEDKIYERLKNIKSIKNMTLIKKKKSRFIGTYNCITKNICAIENVVNDAIGGEVDRTLIHECIHCLQNGRMFFKCKSIKGIMEGCTESYVVKICDEFKKRYINTNEISYIVNYSVKTSYVENVSIIEQIETIMGEELIEKLALYGDTEVLKKLIEQYGIKFYERIRKGLNKILKLKTKIQKILFQQELQNIILKVCYERKFEEVHTIQEAIQYLKELKQIETKRIEIKGDTTLKKFYMEKYEKFIKRFSNQRYEIEQLKSLKYN